MHSLLPSLFQREGRRRQKIFEAVKSAKAKLVISLSRPQACGTFFGITYYHRIEGEVAVIFTTIIKTILKI
ncbi:MAG: hypothetical protein BA862_06120 [Desulfobulbaceae bacterium S3730MH12]|nr:MAG: hypothetical protein BA862_06120 [Desulfobulbaceae bacterium S3730MH12]